MVGFLGCLFFQINECSSIHSLRLCIKNYDYKNKKTRLLPARNLKSSGDVTLLTNYYNIVHEMVSWSHEQNKMRVKMFLNLHWREGKVRKGVL